MKRSVLLDCEHAAIVELLSEARSTFPGSWTPTLERGLTRMRGAEDVHEEPGPHRRGSPLTSRGSAEGSGR